VDKVLSSGDCGSRGAASCGNRNTRVAKLIRAARYYGSYIGYARFVAERIETHPNNSSLLMASVYDIKLFVHDNGRRNAYR